IVNRVIDICHSDFEFETFQQVIDFFKKIINICKQMNYSEFESEKYRKYEEELDKLISERKKA
ncbi:MAG: V-type ATP synthase subunit A, partial [Bacteroidaceae bacterium]|nr:V-type ATP synthase subunit A [Bacteroidaceae bacterium]